MAIAWSFKINIPVQLWKKKLCKMTQVAFTSARGTGYLIKLQTNHRQVILGL